ISVLALARQLGGLLAQFLGLIGERRNLALHVFGMQRRQFLGILGAHQLFGKLERGRDIALSEADCHFANLLGAGPRIRGLVIRGVDRMLRGRDVTVEGFLACSTLFSANARISAGISKFAVPLVAITSS